jgi:hypothetical protein
MGTASVLRFATTMRGILGRIPFASHLLRWLGMPGSSAHRPDDGGEVDNSALWHAMEALSASVPDERWEALPSDGGKNLDEHLRRSVGRRP